MQVSDLLAGRVAFVTGAARGIGRAGTAREAAGAVFLLWTPWSDWITGQLLVVSGGQVFGMPA